MPAPRVIVFGATHLGIRLAQRLRAQAIAVRMIDPRPAGGDARDWEYACNDYVVPPEAATARTLYVVTDEDKLNIRIALAIRRVTAEAPIVLTLTQTRLGEKLSRQLPRVSFLNPPELAATRFVEAVYAPRPEGEGAAAASARSAAPPDAPERWRLDPLVLRAIAVIVLLGCSATVYFHFAEKLRWVDSLYFVVTMMATVGFGDFSLREASTLSKLVGIVVMIASIVNTAVIFALITDSLLKKRLVLSFGRRRIRQRDHIIVAGIGSVGLRVVEQLRARGEQVVVIDSHEAGRYLAAIYARRLPTIIGDARLERTLRDAGISRAKALLSVTNDDLTNLEIGLNAKVLRPDMRVVLRIFDLELAESLRTQLDVHFALSMSSIAAERLATFATETAALPPAA